MFKTTLFKCLGLLILTLFSCRTDNIVLETLDREAQAQQILFLKTEVDVMVDRYNEVHSTNQQQLQSANVDTNTDAFQTTWGEVSNVKAVVIEGTDGTIIFVEPLVDLVTGNLKNLLLTWSDTNDTHHRIIDSETVLTSRTFLNTPIPLNILDWFTRFESQNGSLMQTSNHSANSNCDSPGLPPVTEIIAELPEGGCYEIEMWESDDGCQWHWSYVEVDCGSAGGDPDNGDPDNGDPGSGNDVDGDTGDPDAGGGGTGGNPGGGGSTDPECIDGQTNFGVDEYSINDQPDCGTQDCIAGFDCSGDTFENTTPAYEACLAMNDNNTALCDCIHKNLGCDEIDPCEIVVAQGKNPGYQQNLQTLKEAALENNYESIYAGFLTDQGYEYSSLDGIPNTTGIELTIDNQFLPILSNFSHNHYTGLLSVFSPDDLITLYIMASHADIGNTNTLNMSIITASGTLYAIYIDDLSKFIAFGDEHFTDAFSINLMAAMFEQSSQITPEQTNDDNEQRFLNYLESLDVGLQMYKGDYENFSTWKKLSLNSNNDVIELDC